MTERAWKRTEREIAGLLGGKRVPVSGRQRGDMPDVSHPWLSVEVKLRRLFPGWLRVALHQATSAAKPGQLPIVVLHQRMSLHNGDLVVMRLADFREWFGSVPGGGGDAAVAPGEALAEAHQEQAPDVWAAVQRDVAGLDAALALVERDTAKLDESLDALRSER